MPARNVPAAAGFALAVLATAAATQAAEPADADAQLAAAIQAAPEDRREGARVLGWTADGKVVELRAGSNDLVCLAARPGTPQWSVACYHESLEPFMARGRELLAQGITGEESASRCAKHEIAEGSLAMPREPRTLYVLHGSGFDAESRQGDRSLPAVGHLHALRDSGVDRPHDPTGPRSALAHGARALQALT